MPKIKFTRKMLSIPYVIFLILFVVIPLVLVIFYAFTDEAGRFSLQNVVTFFSNSTNLIHL
jgi:spermidine/putrescine transport system permease protein